MFKEFCMKDVLKAFGLIALVAVIGFSMAVCDDGANDNGGTSVPNAPTGLDITDLSSSSISVSWNSVSGATSYKVYYTTDSSSTTKIFAGTVTETSYTHTGLQADTTYYYYIKAVNNVGESDYSSYTYAVTPSSVPSIPTGGTATALSSSSISVSWNSVSGATSYKVYYEIGSSTTKNLAGTVSGTSYTHTGLQADTTYWYYITAVNSAGESDYSDYIYARTSTSGNGGGGGTSKPSTPTNFYVYKSSSYITSSSIKMDWYSVTGATGYYVYRSSSADGTYIKVETTASTSYTDTGLSANTIYYYKVSAYNSAGESSMSSYDYATTSASSSGGGGTVPSAPTGVTATALSSSSINVSWSQVSNATSYDVYYEIGSSTTKNFAGNTTSTSYTHTGLTASTTYYYYIKAKNSAGSSDYSLIKSVTTLSSSSGGGGTVPNAPTGVSATAQSSSSILISWSSVTGATSYNIEVRTTSTGTWSSLTTVSGTSYTHTGLSADTQRWYRVFAVNSAGTSSASSIVNATTQSGVTIPNAPIDVTATAQSTSSIQISWKSVTGATSYNIEVRTTSTGTWLDLSTVSGAGTSYTHTGLSANTQRWYRVFAINSAGTSSASSTVDATTNPPAPTTAPTVSYSYSYSDQQITYTWSAVTNATSYEYQWRRATDSSWYSITTTTTRQRVINIGGPRVEYQFRVRAVNVTGKGPWGTKNVTY